MKDITAHQTETESPERYPACSRSTYRTDLEPPASTKRSCNVSYKIVAGS